MGQDATVTDIVERLREDARGGKAYHALSDEAADEIERLEDLLVGHFDKTTEIAKWQARATLAEVEIERLTIENWQLKQACGYSIPADMETIRNPFKCGTCDAKAVEIERLRARLRGEQLYAEPYAEDTTGFTAP